jgi:hypothetical protein
VVKCHVSRGDTRLTTRLTPIIFFLTVNNLVQFKRVNDCSSKSFFFEHIKLIRVKLFFIS